MSCKFRRHLLCGPFVAVLLGPPAVGQEVAIDTGKLSRAVIAETNAYRASKGLPALQVSLALQAAATTYAKFLAQSEGVGHTADGRTPAIGAAAWMQGGRVVFRVVQDFGDECHAKPLGGWVTKIIAPAKRPAS